MPPAILSTIPKWRILLFISFAEPSLQCKGTKNLANNKGKHTFFQKKPRNRLQIRIFLLLLCSEFIITKMKATEQTQQMLERAVRKIAEKYPATDEATLLTDIHIRVTQETGELMAFDDDDNELTRCVIEQWIDNKEDNFYEQVTSLLRRTLEKSHSLVDNMSILKPYAFVLEDDDKENLGELYVADDDTVIINPELMAGLDDDLDRFLKDLMKD